eukprot:s704_g24.t1
MSVRADSPGAAQMSTTLESTLAPLVRENVLGVTLRREEALQNNDGTQTPVDDFSEVFSRPGTPEPFGFSHDALPGPTLLDSDNDLGFEQLDGFQQCCTADYDIVGDNSKGSDVEAEIVPGTSEDLSGRDVEWLLNLGNSAAIERGLETERLGPDPQMPGPSRAAVLPGLGVDSSAWALHVETPKFFWETDPFLNVVFGQGTVSGPELKRPAVVLDLTGTEPTDVLSLLRKPCVSMLFSLFCRAWYEMIKQLRVQGDLCWRHAGLPVESWGSVETWLSLELPGLMVWRWSLANVQGPFDRPARASQQRRQKRHPPEDVWCRWCSFAAGDNIIVDANAKSAEAYNRDSMGPAVEQLVQTLRAIKQGSFKPDESRSGRFPKQFDNSLDFPVEQAEQTASDSDSSFVPDSDTSSDSDEFPFAAPGDSTLLWHLVTPNLRPGFVEIPENCAVYRNNASGVQHLKMNGSVRFLCGRRECARYTYFAGKPIKGVAICDPCLHSRDLVSESRPSDVPLAP